MLKISAQNMVRHHHSSTSLDVKELESHQQENSTLECEEADLTPILEKSSFDASTEFIKAYDYINGSDRRQLTPVKRHDERRASMFEKPFVKSEKILQLQQQVAARTVVVSRADIKKNIYEKLESINALIKHTQAYKKELAEKQDRPFLADISKGVHDFGTFLFSDDEIKEMPVPKDLDQSLQNLYEAKYALKKLERKQSTLSDYDLLKGEREIHIKIKNALSLKKRVVLEEQQFLKEEDANIEMAYTVAEVTADVVISGAIVVATIGTAGLGAAPAAVAGVALRTALKAGVKSTLKHVAKKASLKHLMKSSVAGAGLRNVAIGITRGVAVGTPLYAAKDVVKQVNENVRDKDMDFSEALASIDGKRLLEMTEKGAKDSLKLAMTSTAITPMVKATSVSVNAVAQGVSRITAQQAHKIALSMPVTSSCLSKVAPHLGNGILAAKLPIIGGVIGGYDGFAKEFMETQNLSKSLDRALHSAKIGAIGGAVLAPIKGFGGELTRHVNKKVKVGDEYSHLSKMDKKLVDRLYKDMKKTKVTSENKHLMSAEIEKKKIGVLTKGLLSLGSEVKTKTELMIMLSLGEVGLSVAELKGFEDGFKQGGSTFSKLLHRLPEDVLKSLAKDLTRKLGASHAIASITKSRNAIRSKTGKVGFEKLLEMMVVSKVGETTKEGVQAAQKTLLE